MGKKRSKMQKQIAKLPNYQNWKHTHAQKNNHTFMFSSWEVLRSGKAFILVMVIMLWLDWFAGFFLIWFVAWNHWNNKFIGYENLATTCHNRSHWNGLPSTCRSNSACEHVCTHPPPAPSFSSEPFSSLPLRLRLVCCLALCPHWGFPHQKT